MARKPARQAVAAPEAVVTAIPQEMVSITEEDRRAAIAEMAYFLAEQRGFEPGREMDDWLAAEAMVQLGADGISAP